MSKQVQFRAVIRNHESSLRFGGEIPIVTLDVCPADEPEVVALIALKMTPLLITVEVDDEYQGNPQGDNSKAKRAKGAARPWLRKGASKTDG